ncbi:MAG: zinc D-Ala-D-Ala carboxypeptidase [Streptosporangiaceae bacterium]|nr:peptidase and DD-carboxypeptidase VanY/endolysin [Streptosporangiaceae bacterium]MDX6430701.1 zinc D-Ala-D-Ala carboxypeptidase [Streptosporangiaceae bacterium]
MRTPRSAGLFAVITVVASLVSAPGYAAQQPGRGTVEELRKQAAKARTDLEKATKQLDSRRRALEQSQTTLKTTLTDLGVADTDLNRIREPLARLANVAYEGGANGSMAVFSSGDPQGALSAAADLVHLADGQNALVKRAAELRTRREQLAATAQDLQSKNGVEQAKVQRQIDALKARSVQLTQQLTQSLGNLSGASGLAAACDPALVTEARRFPNGLIPARYLCPLPQRHRMLRADAALAFYKFNAAFKTRFKHDMCLTDSYRSLADQQRIYSQRPGMAAVPGRSNHGLGTAVDVCGGVQNQGSVPFNWLLANSLKYGWFHPKWAYVSPFEPWHWEFKSGKSQAIADPGH